MGKFIGHVFIYLFNFSLTFLKEITYYTTQLTYDIGLTILNYIGSFVVDYATFTDAFLDTLSKDLSELDKERLDILNYFTKSIPGIIGGLKGGSIIQKNKIYYNKYLKYKTKYLALK
jgi:hypothetical protein